MPETPPLREPKAVQPASSAMTARRVSSRDLLAGATHIVIEHAGREYRLRITQNGKLILTA